ncbi:MAG: phosphate ABC transporter substrate-binding/OmpA family protein [Candidatus Pelagadaptatus aseana]|uniref:substrate-binding domain-containing protein n=1 Tax=Candidatus Pelagadaptatus aseana TaxID=3120508 RepID=UPI0039B2E8E9
MTLSLRNILSRLGVGVALLSSSGSCFANFDITIHGSNTLGAKLIPECAKGFLENKGVNNPRLTITAENEFLIQGSDPFPRIAIAAHGSSTGFRSLNSGSADIGMSSRPIKQKEVDQLSFLGHMTNRASEHPVALDGLAILVHQSNAIDALNTDQIAQIFSGQINNWKMLGGPDQAINLHARDNNSGTWDTFKNLVLRKVYTLDARAKRYESNDDLSDAVAADPAAIGFSGLASVRNSKALLVSYADTQPVAAGRLSVATEDYPLTRRLFLYTPEKAPVITREFIEFCQSQQGQDIVKDVGYISQNIIAVAHNIDRSAPADYQAIASQGQRLSVNFRFNHNSAKLDNKAFWDVGRLKSFMALPQNRGKQLVLVGFNDRATTDDRSKILSKLRATAVRSALFRNDIAVSKTLGLGDYMPVASSGTSSAAAKNGRVEVWLVN